jgi:transcriptional regulator with XRE-family HTH domain
MQTIGERLEEARKKKGISIREAAEATKIRGDYLQKFESNQFDIGLTEIYTRGFLRNYATFLKLPADRILNDYASLGRGDVRPRQPSREIYGRMDISVATAGAPSDRAAPPEEAPAAEPAAGAPRAQPRYPRGSGSALPSGPDPALVFKYVKWGAIVVGALLILLIAKALFSGSRTPAAASRATPVASSAPTPAISANNYRLIATDTVFVRVTRLIGDDTDGEEVFKGTLSKGEAKTIPWDGPQNVWASEGDNLKIEWRGTTYPMQFHGYGHGQMRPKS